MKVEVILQTAIRVISEVQTDGAGWAENLHVLKLENLQLMFLLPKSSFQLKYLT